jgi:ubiquinone/menaquinone biosynthesis C-methylase UbiE
MTAAAVSPSEAFDTWAQVYDDQPNPLLLLEQRFLSQMLPDVAGLDVLDAGCGTGRWLQLLASSHPASLIGVDASAQMLHRAGAKLGSSSSLRLGSCTALPVGDAAVDLVLASFVTSYLENVDFFARELHRVTRPGATIFLTDMHPDTAISCNWKRSFKVNAKEEQIPINIRFIHQITDTFQSCGFEVLTLIEPHFELEEKKVFEQNGKLDFYEASEELPAIYILHLRKKASVLRAHNQIESFESLHFSGANYAVGPEASTAATVAIERGHIRSILSNRGQRKESASNSSDIDLAGYLLLPGLINAHDHLEFGLFPNLGAGPLSELFGMGKRDSPDLRGCHRPSS